ncbi:hypothetical protein [Streptomyces solicathayae]|uniref:Lipoprotein n=1 Tax=Streptomyces solicathayae TaxID=3081768 RepID=A0ABZ0LR36_9ACTN|nr:hypothetical protein [Streptomyces sp. HUAS YS2]WOX21780.1 hypothetical protein R2D22_10370 [Streptomyces sp. HUAS YS2]
MFGTGKSTGLRKAGAAAALTGVLLTGCSSTPESDDKPRPEASPSAPASTSPVPTAGALTEAQLKAAALTDGEKAGKYTVSDYTLGAPLGEAYTADPAVCQPLVSLAEDVADPDPAAEVHRKADIPEETVGTTVAVTLRAYGADGAKTVLKNLNTAGKQCAAGFVEQRAVAQAKYLKVETLPAPKIGDEAVAFRFTILDVKGALTLYEYLTVVRAGTTTLAFRADITDTKDIGGVPAEVIDAQWKKFRGAART